MFGRNAAAVSEALRGAMAHLPVDINPRPPRRNSFEVSLVKEDGSSKCWAGRAAAAAPRHPRSNNPLYISPAVELWSGIGKGPPRKLKFPQPETVVEALKSSLP